jgi:uncharacterized membrane protein (UPF0127 family)
MQIIFRYNFQNFIIKRSLRGRGILLEATGKSQVFMKIFWKYSFLLFFFLTFYPQGPWAQEGKKSLLPLTIKGKTIKVEVARTEKEKEKGLMFRERLGKDEGMLFVYEGEEILSFWMKNTRLPLSIAFIDKRGKIVDIQDMEPFSLQTYISAYPAKYALEMNRGWFKRNGIKVGDFVKVPLSLKK